MATWAVPKDVTDAWIGDDAPADAAKLALWIGRAERLVRSNVKTLQARIDAEVDALPPSTDLIDTTRDVVVEMVSRVFRNPKGIRQANVTTGPYTESQTFGGDQPGQLMITADELAQLTGAGSGQRAYTVSMIPSSSPFYREA